jgi:hypothetical protein
MNAEVQRFKEAARRVIALLTGDEKLTTGEEGTIAAEVGRVRTWPLEETTDKPRKARLNPVGSAPRHSAGACLGRGRRHDPGPPHVGWRRAYSRRAMVASDRSSPSPRRPLRLGSRVLVGSDPHHLQCRLLRPAHPVHRDFKLRHYPKMWPCLRLGDRGSRGVAHGHVR